MSGGAYDYFYIKLEEFVDELEINDNPNRIAFKQLLKEIAKCAHDVEWADSGDYSDKQADDSLNDLFSKYFNNPNEHVKSVCFDKMVKIMKEVDNG